MLNTSPPAREPRDSLEAIQIDDAAMVFRSKQASDSTPEARKFVVKKPKMKLKMRKSTPAPNLKRDGRKRLVESPLPEDKQICKRIDFGDDSTLSPDAPKCKAEIFPATPSHGREELLQAQSDSALKIDEQHSLAIVCYNPPDTLVGSPAAGPGADVVIEMNNMVTGGSTNASRSNSADTCKSNCTLDGEKVDFPEIGHETKCLLESSLESCQFEESHASLAVGDQVQPKVDNLLTLASLDSADMLDVEAAQPLLAGNTLLCPNA